MSIQMARQPGLDNLDREGDYIFVRRWRSPDGWEVCHDTKGFLCLAVILPGERAASFLPVEPCDDWLNGGVSWEWNGDEDSPTLTPSVDGSKIGKWHGHIVNGVMK